MAKMTNAAQMGESTEDNIYEIFAHREYDIQERSIDPITFVMTATSNPARHYVLAPGHQGARLCTVSKSSNGRSKVEHGQQTLHTHGTKGPAQGTRGLASVWS